MILGSGVKPEHLSNVLDGKSRWSPVAEPDASVDYVTRHLSVLNSSEYRTNLKSYQTFLPPRLVAAAKVGGLVPFFGAGVSGGAGVPSWATLLERLGGTGDLTSEPLLENDPLTLAELLAHEIGNVQLQDELRAIMLSKRIPSVGHYLLAQLSQPVYVTSNYDTLLEIAWEQLHEGPKPLVVTNDGDFVRFRLDPDNLKAPSGEVIILKIHGCASRKSEEMILTRSQYRRHYRTNKQLFKAVSSLLQSRHTLFLGFGHRDPEISRLVEDVIYRYENPGILTAIHPAFYSLQFDMKERTPEVFAARGIVALQPPLSLDSPQDFDYRTAGLSKALIDLIGAMDASAHEKLDLDTELEHSVRSLSTALEQAMVKLSLAGENILQFGSDLVQIHNEILAVQVDLGALAGQGVYLLQQNGDIVDCVLPAVLSCPDRRVSTSLSDRFYVRQAKTFRKAFVSDSAASQFNGQSTVFLCQPLGGESEYKGLLFAAAQIGAWALPVDLAATFLGRHLGGSFVLVDSNGVALVPPDGRPTPARPLRIPNTEKAEDNIGFDYADLHRLSRRDQLVARVWRNIVPLAQDDDVHSFSDLRMYSVASEVAPTRWKLALSVPLVMKNL